MKAKTKTTQGKTKTAATRKRVKPMHYPAHYLAGILAMFILLEGFMIGVATPQGVRDGLAVLDVSEGVSQMVNDFSTTVEPMFDMVYSVNKFYQLAAVEMTGVLDLSESDFLAFPRGVVEFYDLASIEMMDLLDFSGQLESMPVVAGISIFK